MRKNIDGYRSRLLPMMMGAMTMTTRFHLDRGTVLHLASDLSMRPLGVTSDYWEHAVKHSELADGRILSVFEYERTWDWWERHPVGDEFVHVLSGRAVFQLEDDVATSAIELATGESALIPEGAWHRAELEGHTTLLFVTPVPAWTEHRQADR
jgi:quercetin dioxygenase-like cupin family protein